MADNAQKTPFNRSLGARAIATTLQHVQNLGQRAPVTIVSMDKTNTIATVKFETDGTYTLPNITIPVHGPEYTRWPLKKGDKGVVGAADIDLGAMTGLGAAGLATFTRPGNLAALLFHPLGNANFAPTDDPKKHVTYGDSGTIARDAAKKSQVSTDSVVGAQIAGGGDGNGNYDHTSTAHASGVTHKSTKKVVSDAPTHDFTGAASAAGAVSGATGSFPQGLSGGGLQMLGGLLSKIGGSQGGVSASALETGAATANIVGTGLPVYASADAAFTALGPNQFYVNSSLGAVAGSSSSTGSGSGTTTTVTPAQPSFYAQGILVACVTRSS